MVFDLLREWWQGSGEGGAEEAEAFSGCCVACNSADIELFAPGAYRCRSCGYSGGPGFAAYEDRRELERIAAMTPEARHAGARNDLLEARTILLACIGDLELARRGAVADVLDLTDDQDESERQNALITGIGRVLEASKLVTRAERQLGGSFTASPDVDTGGTFGSALGWRDGFITELRAARRTEAIAASGRMLLAYVGQRLVGLGVVVA